MNKLEKKQMVIKAFAKAYLAEKSTVVGEESANIFAKEEVESFSSALFEEYALAIQIGLEVVYNPNFGDFETII